MIGGVVGSGVGFQPPGRIVEHGAPASAETHHIATYCAGDERGNRKRLKIEYRVVLFAPKTADQMDELGCGWSNPGEIDPGIPPKQLRDGILGEEMNPGSGPDLTKGVQDRSDEDGVTDPAPLDEKNLPRR